MAPTPTTAATALPTTLIAALDDVLAVALVVLLAMDAMFMVEVLVTRATVDAVEVALETVLATVRRDVMVVSIWLVMVLMEPAAEVELAESAALLGLTMPNCGVYWKEPFASSMISMP